MGSNWCLACTEVMFNCESACTQQPQARALLMITAESRGKHHITMVRACSRSCVVNSVSYNWSVWPGGLCCQSACRLNTTAAVHCISTACSLQSLPLCLEVIVKSRCFMCACTVKPAYCMHDKLLQTCGEGAKVVSRGTAARCMMHTKVCWMQHSARAAVPVVVLFVTMRTSSWMQSDNPMHT